MSTEPKEDAPKRVSFHFIKSNSFRVIHVDGAHGGINPNLMIQMALFSERIPIPQRSVQEIRPDGSLGDEIWEERIAREGLIREVEVEAIMDLGTARSIIQWLTEHAQRLEEIHRQLKKKDNA
jgi:hypothetical protein